MTSALSSACVPSPALGLTLQDFSALLKHSGFPAFRAKQLMQWLYHKGVADPALFTDFSKADRERLTALLSFTLPTVSTAQHAADGVVKWLFRLHDGHEIEAVYIPEETRGTLCVSSQVGCTTSCRFCHTGTQGLARNLEAHEIVAQVWLAKQTLGDFQRPDNTKHAITNLVFMGMGEPLFNFDNVTQALRVLMDDAGFAFGGRKITVSTSGVANRIKDLAPFGTHLAISLHAPNDELRTRIMPINNRWGLDELMAAIRAFPLREHRRITWEYVMLKDTNDSLETAKELVRLIQGIPSLVNIIPFNEWPGSPFQCSNRRQIEGFASVLRRSGVDVTIRKTRGDDILAACGQLRGETSKFNTVSAAFPSVVAQYGSEKQKTLVQIEHEAEDA